MQACPPLLYLPRDLSHVSRSPAAIITAARLTNTLDPSAKYKGRLEVQIGGVWGTVCDDAFTDDLNAAQVAIS